MKIAIIGCGHMGTGLAKRLSQHHEIRLYDHDPNCSRTLALEGYGEHCETAKDAIKASEWSILAVKPQNLEEAAEQIHAFMNSSHVLISLLAGTTLSTLRQHFPSPLLVRMMPNLAVIYGEGVVGLTPDSHLTSDQIKRLEDVFSSLGKLFWIPESKMNALTALTGSGPAFMFTLIEAMIEAGLGMGFNKKESQELILQMIQGSITLLKETAKHPAELKWQITSPGGTTIAGLKKLEESGMRGHLINTFFASYEKTKEMSQN